MKKAAAIPAMASICSHTSASRANIHLSCDQSHDHGHNHQAQPRLFTPATPTQPSWTPIRQSLQLRIHAKENDVPTQNQIREAITNQIVDALKSGDLPPWRRPWALDRNAGPPRISSAVRTILASTRSSAQCLQ
jgi:hypothetical protein